MKSELIYESIVTSIDAQGQLHIAPFGIRVRDSFYMISPFKPSTSLSNFIETKCAVINHVDDVRIFAGALVGRRNWATKKAEVVDGFILDSALTHIEIKLEKVIEHEIRPELYFSAVHQVTHQPFMGFNRAQAAVVELAVLVSRLNILPIKKILDEIVYLEIAISKTAGPREIEAWGWLIDKVKAHQLLQENKSAND